MDNKIPFALFAALCFLAIPCGTWFFSYHPRLFIRVFVPREEWREAVRLDPARADLRPRHALDGRAAIHPGGVGDCDYAGGVVLVRRIGGLWFSRRARPPRESPQGSALARRASPPAKRPVAKSVCAVGIGGELKFDAPARLDRRWRPGGLRHHGTHLAPAHRVLPLAVPASLASFATGAMRVKRQERC